MAIENLPVAQATGPNDRAVVALAEKVKAQVLSPRGRVERDGHIDEAETNRAFPNRSRGSVLRYSAAGFAGSPSLVIFRVS